MKMPAESSPTPTVRLTDKIGKPGDWKYESNTEFISDSTFIREESFTGTSGFYLIQATRRVLLGPGGQQFVLYDSWPLFFVDVQTHPNL